MKKYLVIAMIGNFICRIHVRSVKRAKWIANLKFWRYAKIHNHESKCIYIVKEERVRIDES